MELTMFQGIALLITAVGSFITAAGGIYIAFRQLPKQAAQIEVVHKLTNSMHSELKAEVNNLRQELRDAQLEAIKRQDEALIKEELRPWDPKTEQFKKDQEDKGQGQ